jgi:hypothetical protein
MSIHRNFTILWGNMYHALGDIYHTLLYMYHVHRDLHHVPNDIIMSTNTVTVNWGTFTMFIDTVYWKTYILCRETIRYHGIYIPYSWEHIFLGKFSMYFDTYCLSRRHLQWPLRPVTCYGRVVCHGGLVVCPWILLTCSWGHLACLWRLVACLGCIVHY